MMGDLRNTVIMDLEAYDEMQVYAEQLRKASSRKEEMLSRIYAYVRDHYREDVRKHQKAPCFLFLDAEALTDLVGYYPEDDPEVQSVLAQPVEELEEVNDEGYQE